MHNLFLVYFVNLYTFRAYLGPSSGGIISTNCYIHTAVHPDDGPRLARNMYRLTKYTKNKLCIKLVFLYTITSNLVVFTVKIYTVTQTNLSPEVFFSFFPHFSFSISSRHCSVLIFHHHVALTGMTNRQSREPSKKKQWCFENLGSPERKHNLKHFTHD